MKKYIKYILCCLCLSMLAACQIGKQETNHRMKVVTTIYPVYYMTQAIAGDVADVSMLLDSTVEAHDYDPSAKDIAKINDATLFIYSNEFMETWVKKVQDSLGATKKVVFVESGEDVPFLRGSQCSHNHGDNQEHKHNEKEHQHDTNSIDPHIWLEPKIAKIQVETIAKALINADAKNKELYETNRDILLEKLDALAKDYTQSLSMAKNKQFVTQHAAFGYVAKEYGLEQISVSGLSAKEPTAQDIAFVVEEMRTHQLNTIYVEPNTSKATADTVAHEIGATVDYLYTMETKVNDMDYLQVLQANLTALKKSIK